MTMDTLRQKTKTAVKSLLPPLLLSAARSCRGRITQNKPAEWEYVPEGWAAQEDDPGLTGWDTRSVLEAYQGNWSSFLKEIQGSRPFGSPPGGTNLVRQTIVLSFAHALATAAHGRSHLSLLDWGGGFGHYFLISRALYPDLKIDYHCKDVPILAQGGRAVLPDVHFYDDETCLARTYDFVFASCSLNYSQDWPRVLALAGATANYLMVTRLPIVEAAEFLRLRSAPTELRNGLSQLVPEPGAVPGVRIGDRS